MCQISPSNRISILFLKKQRLRYQIASKKMILCPHLHHYCPLKRPMNQRNRLHQQRKRNIIRKLMSTNTSMRRNMSIKRSIQNHNLAYLFPIDFIFVFCSLEFLSYSYRCSSPPFFPHTILLITHTNIDRKQIEREVCCSPNPVLSQYSV